MTTQPETQHSRNPLTWGWYYVSDTQNGKATGLMNKRAAINYIKSGSMNGYAYGKHLCKHQRAPKSILRYFTFPVKTG